MQALRRTGLGTPAHTRQCRRRPLDLCRSPRRWLACWSPFRCHFPGRAARSASSSHSAGLSPRCHSPRCGPFLLSNHSSRARPRHLCHRRCRSVSACVLPCVTLQQTLLNVVVSHNRRRWLNCVLFAWLPGREQASVGATSTGWGGCHRPRRAVRVFALQRASNHRS